MLTVFYDGKCGLCSREINYYKSIAPVNSFYWFDIATDPKPLASLKISQSDALRRLHTLDEAGQLYVGVPAFISIWQRLHYWRLLALLMKLPFLVPLATFVYNRFADYRFERLTHCQIAEQSTK